VFSRCFDVSILNEKYMRKTFDSRRRLKNRMSEDINNGFTKSPDKENKY
jgi:hypothetical protein